MTISVPPHHRRVAPRSTHVLAKMMVPAMAVGAPSGVPFHELPKSHEFTPLTPFHLRERAIHKLDQLMDLSEIVASRPLRHNWHQSNVAQDAKIGSRPHGLQVLAKIVVPAIAVGAPAGSTGGHTTLANGDEAISPTAMTPHEGAHIANILCDPRALETAMHHIKNLSSNFRSVRSSFDKVVMSIETLDLLNPLDRYHVRHATRQLEVVRALSERFEGMVQQSHVEARQAASVVTRYRDTVLDAVHERQSIEALKGEIQQIAQAIADHERNAERLERDFHDVSQSIHAVSAIILESVKRNQARIDFEALTTLCDNTMELDKNMAQCDESSLAFLHALLGIGQHCAGLAVAAFGPDTALFDDDTTAAYRQYFADKLWEYLPRLSHKKTMSDLRGTKRNNYGVTDPKKASLTQNLASLDDSAAKVSDMAGLWSALNMDLHKISSWLSLKLEGGEVQGSWELLGESVNIMRGSTADLIRHLHDYSTSNL